MKNTAGNSFLMACCGFIFASVLLGRGQDSNQTSVVSVISTGSQVRVFFSLPVQAAGAANLSNYSITNLYGAVNLLAASLGSNGQVVQLTAAGQVPFMQHWLNVKGVVDALTGTNFIDPDSSSTYTNVGFTTGYIESDFYTGLAGTTIASLTNSANFPNHPTRVNYYPNSYWFDSTIGANYGNRMFGFLVPPVSGPYQFLVYSPGTSQFALSTNEDPAFKKVVATMTGGNYVLSPQIRLEAGQHYYFEALAKEGTPASDYVELGWATPADTNALALIPTENIGNYLVQPNATVRITQQPSDASVYVARNATFSVSAASSSRITACTNYQWQLNGVDIPGATSATYTTPLLWETNNGATYRALVMVPGAALFSSNAILNVTRDQVPPSIVHGLNLGLEAIQLVFSEPVDPSSATDLSHFAFANGLPILGISLDSAQLTVTLITPPLTYGSNYTLVVNGVRDQAFVPNTIPASTLVQVLPSRPTSDDIGNLPVGAETTWVTNGANVLAAGRDIGGTSDQFSFVDQAYSGDFDVKLQLASLTGPDLWAKAGIMARETKDSGARFAAALATPSMNGMLFESRDPARTASSLAGNLPANFPDTWLRLTRAGSIFTGYGSYDGRTWAELGSAFINMSNLVYVGFATASHDSSRPILAEFRDFGLVGSEAVLGAVDMGHEVLGPSSRKTPIVFSEVMYKPAPRSDTNNLEYIELYNSNPWFHDIGGYQVLGDNLSYTIPPGTTLPGGGFLVLAASPQSMQSVYGITNLLGPYSGSLKKAGQIRLLDEHGAVLLSVPYSNSYPWPVAADGTGHSLVLANPTYGEEDPRAWAISEIVGGSPGTMESFRPNRLRNVVINEVLAHTENPNVPDFIELYNHDNLTNDLSGVILTDDPLTNKFTFPSSTLIPPHGFLTVNRFSLGFGLKAGGQTVYLLNPDRSRVLDAVQVQPMAEGVSFGRWPDGANDFYPLAARTPGTNNSAILMGDIVINELMYDPISRDDDDQYLEIYNQGTKIVDLTDWQITPGISFTFPSNTLIRPDSYLVIARNVTNLLAKYPNLNTGNTLGNYAGKLSHGGERVALAMPQIFNGTNRMLVVEDEVTYGTGGRWGKWAAGGGSSLELVDPRANHRLAANWADSDETQKSAWVSIETTGVLDNGQNFGPGIDCAQIGLLDEGECLVDNIEVHAGTSGVNYALNPGFESGLANWSLQGCMFRSSLENNGYLSAHSLHIRCSSRIWTGANSCQVALSANSLTSGQQATLRFKARWLRGWPEVLLRLHGNWLEAAGAMPVPHNLGTPGAPNSRRNAKLGPAIYEVTHNPPLPSGSQPVVVTARAHDPDGVQSLVLKYRYDFDSSYTSLPMKDDGTDGDVTAGDGIFSATIPAMWGQLAAFYVSATDGQGAASRFPALLGDNAPDPECVVRFGDESPGGSFAGYHLWLTQTNQDRWSQLPNLSNEMHDGTLVSGRRVIYNMKGRFAGSPYHQEFYSPVYSACHFKWTFPEDDKFLGATSFNKIHAPGNGPGDDSSLQREQTAYSFMRALGVPWLNRRYVAVYVNGYRNLQLMEDTQCPDADMVKEYFPNDTGGYLYKMQPWFEFSANGSGSYLDFQNFSWVTIMSYGTAGGAKKTARYRYTFEVRQTPDSASNFTNVFALIDAASASFAAPNYTANIESVADMENWMRVFAANHAAGNWDSFGSQNGQNLYGYIGAKDTRYSLLMFDFNIILGNSGSWEPGQNLFVVNPLDGNLGKMLANPRFRRMYLRALQELVDGPLTIAKSGPLIDAKYQTFVANGLNVESSSAIKSWLDSARINISSQITKASFSVNPVVSVADNVAFISGTAPVGVKTIWLNGVEWPLTWKSVTSWTATVPLQPGNNWLSVIGVDIHGHPVPGASNAVSVVYGGTVASPVNQVVFSEIMYRPAVPKAQYLELQNSSVTTTFDLSGWTIPELSYTFPAGSILGPRKFLLLVADRFAFIKAYGASIPMFDTFPGSLPVAGGSLTLLKPGTDGDSDLVVSKVRYESDAPWPAAANGSGGSLQLVDVAQDNWRVANWAATPHVQSPGSGNTVLANLAPFPALWLNEVQPDNLTGITNGAGQHVAWLEIYNPSTNAVALDGLFLATDYTNLASWPLPVGVWIQPGEFKVVFADGQTNLSSLTEWHASFQLASGSGSLALSRLDTNGVPQVLDYLNYTNLGPNHSYGSAPDGQSFQRQEFFYATPGGSNSVRTPLPVAINEWMAGNTNTLRNPVTGKFDDWFELYNYGESVVDLAGYYLTHTLTNLFEFRIPPGYTVAPHGFLLVWADKRDTNGTPDLHVNFKLNKSGTALGLFTTNGVPVDLVSFGEQTSDISMGRYPDGAGNIYVLPRATPGSANHKPNAAPSLAAPGDRFVYVGQGLDFALQANDADIPPQVLTYTLDRNAPPNAMVDATTGRFSWFPTLNQAPSTNYLTVRVTDHGVPPLSRQQTFSVIVALPPQFVTETLDGGLYALSWPTGPDRTYQIEYKDDLAASVWNPLGNPLTGTGGNLTITNSFSATSQRFFRLRALP